MKKPARGKGNKGDDVNPVAHHSRDLYRPPNPTNEELAEYREMFNLVDRDGGGSISTREFQQLMETLGIKTSVEELESIVSEIDTDHSGEIDFPEFVSVMSKRAAPSYSSQEIIHAFQVFETADLPPGFVKLETLKEALITYGGDDALSEEQARILLRPLDQDRSGSVRYKDFVKTIMS